MELHSVPGFNATEGEGYTFVDDGEQAEVRVSLPRAGPRGEDLSRCSTSKVLVQTTENTLRVGYKTEQGVLTLVDCEELWAPVRHTETTWTLDTNAREVTVHLTKQDENEPWGSLTRKGKQNEAAKAFAQLEKVKKLFEATREGTPENFDSLLEDLVAAQKEASEGEADKGFPLDQVRDGNQKNSLHFAAQLGNLVLCKHLVEAHNIPVDAQDVEGETALSLSAASAQTEVVSYLLESAGANPNLCSSSSSFPIHRSAMSGDLESLKKLVRFGADVNASSDLGTPLHCAAGSGNEGCVKYLLQFSDKNAAGARKKDQQTVDLEIPDTSGVTPLIASVAAGDKRIVNLLLEAGANPNALAMNGATALHIAASMDDASLITSLVNKGGNANAVDKDNLKPIHAAAVMEGRNALRKLLPITERIPGVEWTEDGMIEDAKEKDGYVKDFTIEEISEGNEMKKADIEIKVLDSEKAADLKSKADGEFRKANFAAAIDLYTQSIESDNSNSAAFANRSAAQIQLKNFQAALEDAVVARTLKPDYMKAYYREGMAQQELGNWEEAAQAYFEGCRIENENTELIKRFQHAMRMAKEHHKASQG
ncbi:ankyrin repeat domain-containing protein [Chloropicon primus]|uniref:Ankyrin repeat domain-containing protein n=1 Tax=Chloropicon primus TaxID=1764295 RepID=A0A5B8MSX2_9CHLO|nr:ankyrin repeat domain-containing protein [Chloropicon primus]UPR03091.1 ankyrin repeat domain-containing protein [Chloropicon primus]|eukprot:QDZ23878.1 ankyrin repeat domain-containing protein [Chloropicon primus]